MRKFEVFERMSPEESIQYPGFYYSPLSRDFVISRDGRVINTLTGKNTSISTQNQSPGYKLFAFNCKGKTKNYSHHRVLALTFIGRPGRHFDKPHSSLEVNHIDGNKTNNDLTNLEWLTPTENSVHAVQNNLLTHIKSVLARNVITGQIFFFPTQTLCAEHFNLKSIHRFERHLKSNEAGYLTKKWFAFKFDDQTPWPELSENEMVENSWDDVNFLWIAISKSTGKKFIFNTAVQLSYMLFNEPAQLFKTIDGKANYKGYSIERASRASLEEDAPLPEGRTLRPPKALKVVHVATGEERIFESARQAGPALGYHQNWAFGALKAFKINSQRKDFQGYRVSWA